MKDLISAHDMLNLNVPRPHLQAHTFHLLCQGLAIDLINGPAHIRYSRHLSITRCALRRLCERFWQSERDA